MSNEPASKTRNRPSRYLVSVYLADGPIEFPMTDRLSIPLTRLFRGNAFAGNERLAAARIWCHKVGRYLNQRLGGTVGDRITGDAGVDPDSVADRLVPSRLCPPYGGYLLEDHWETWLISVRRARPRSE
ncbi:MAG: hypothetical protein RIC55_14140 [Pirellulaceae bacterium]